MLFFWCIVYNGNNLKKKSCQIFVQALLNHYKHSALILFHKAFLKYPDNLDAFCAKKRNL